MRMCVCLCMYVSMYVLCYSAGVGKQAAEITEAAMTGKQCVCVC